MAKFYRTYVVEINLEDWKSGLVAVGYPNPTKEDFLVLCSDYSIDDIAKWYNCKYDVVDEHIEE